MNISSKQVTYTHINSYETLNTLTLQTKNVWFVFHGIGYLSRYFLKYFTELPSSENYIIAPQAPSKYYLNNAYKHVGASWLTKENTQLETENIFSYLDTIMQVENIPKDKNLIIMGFSQGVSIATRWVAKYKIACSQLVLYAGGIPNELTPQDFEFLIDMKTEIKIIIGNTDEYINETRQKKEHQKIEALFKGRAKLITFDGGHEVKKEILNTLV